MIDLSRLHIAAIDDDVDDLILLRLRLEEVLGTEVVYAPFLEVDLGVSYVVRQQPDVLLLDYRLGARSGLDVLQDLRAASYDGAVVVLTGAASADVAVEMMKHGATDYLGKDQLTDELLVRTLRYALRKAAGDRELAASHAALTKSRDDLQTILSQLRLGTALIGDDGRVHFLNDAGEQIFERRRDEVVGRHWTELGALSQRAENVLKAAMNAPGEIRRKVPLVFEAPSGRTLTLEVDVHRDPERHGQRVLLIYDVSDVVDLRRQLEGQGGLQELVGQSSCMEEVCQLIGDVAPVDVTVLIQGETGTGKGLVARAIHRNSPRATKPFVVVNCAGLNDSLLASQLFGHVRGAFTGAVAAHKGVFEAAEGGTILLDEIGDVPPRVQTALLRVLQDREVTRLGESTPRRVDVRVLAATHRDLSAEVAAGRFRLDLLYRLRVARVLVPPLRERTGDIPLLARWFLKKICAETNKRVDEIADDAMATLMQHTWPGNVRELRSAIASAVVRSRDGVVRTIDLPLEAQSSAKLKSISERERVMEALERSNFNRSAAAKLLGVSRATFYRRLDELGIELRGRGAT